MSPRRGGGRGDRSAHRRSGRRVYPNRRRRWVRPVLSLLAVAVVALALGALYYGFAPGVGVLQSNTARDTAATDSLAELLAAVARPRLDHSDHVDSTDTLLAAFGDSVTITASDSVNGEEVYRRVGRCLGCHGANGEGVPTLAPSLRAPSMARGSLEAIRGIVARGLPATPTYRIAMPAYDEQLSEEQTAAVAAFVYALSHPGRVVADSATFGAPDPRPLP